MPMSGLLLIGFEEKHSAAVAGTRSVTSLLSLRALHWVGLVFAFSLSTPPALAQGMIGVYTGVGVPGISVPGLYLRGMAGAALGTDMKFTDVDSNDPNAVLGSGVQLKGTSTTSPIFSGGIGFKFSPIFWADVTAAGITNLKFNNGSTSAGAFTPLQGMSAKMDAITVMLNGYASLLPAFRYAAGWQPYIVASAGYARNHLGAMNGAVPGFGPVSFAGSTHEDFAWGIGAGVGVPITTNIVLDLQYEYLDLGEARSGNSGTLTIGGVPITAAAGPMKARLQTHTFQAGFRIGF